MIPTVDAPRAFTIPSQVMFWVPGAQDADDWMRGYFQDVWPISHVSRDEALAVIEAERVAIEYIDRHAGDEDTFEELAGNIEYEVPDCPSDAAPEFMADANEVWLGLEGLEVGVAGVAYALACAGLLPAASCRSHFGQPSWSPYPVVIFAGSRSDVESIQPHVREARCGFAIDSERTQLLGIGAPSIRAMSRLATLIVEGLSPQ